MRTSAIALGLGVAWLSLCATTASASTVFAQYELTPAGNENITWTKTGNTATLSGDANGLVDFSFLTNTGLKKFNNLKSLLTISAESVGGATETGGTIDQGVDDGSFDITYEGNKTTIDGHAITKGETLLSGTFDEATLTGSGISWALDSTGGVTYTSPFLSFLAPSGNAFSLDLIAGKTPTFNSGKVLGSFKATSTGSFSGLASDVPEPASWSLLIVGLGLVGTGLREKGKDRRALA